MPAAYRANINVNSMPMNRPPGMAPALSEQDVDDIVAFLRALTDAPYVGAMPPAAGTRGGYRAGAGTALSRGAMPGSPPASEQRLAARQQLLELARRHRLENR